MLDDKVGAIKMCVIDSGYAMGHEDLPNDNGSGDLITGKSFVEDSSWKTDEMRHGTHVTGTIAAIGYNNKGVRGVIGSGKLKLHIVKVFGASGSTSLHTIIEGFQNCVENGAKVINMSFGGVTYSGMFGDEIGKAHYNNGIAIFASSGNSASKQFYYPASYQFVVSVASITEQKTRSLFSTYNAEVDICAPGSGVKSTVPNNLYQTFSGTSFASPHAAGVAALVWSHYPELSNEKLIDILQTTATQLPVGDHSERKDEFGHGLINAKAAYDKVLSMIGSTLPPVSSPSATPAPTICVGHTVTVKIMTDDYPNETEWKIKRESDGKIIEARTFQSENTLHEDFVCLKETASTCYTFIITDSYGDGFCQGGEVNGFYEVKEVDGEVYAKGDKFGSSAKFRMCWLSTV